MECGWLDQTSGPVYRRVSRTIVVVVAAILVVPVFARDDESDYCSSKSTKLPLQATLVLTPQVCGTKLNKGVRGLNHETFQIGRAFCSEIEEHLRHVFFALNRVEVEPPLGKAQVTVVPRFIGVRATQATIAFASRELNAEVNWTVKDRHGTVIWSQNLEGSSKRAQGNLFNHSIQMNRIVMDVATDLAEESESKMLGSQELRKTGEADCEPANSAHK